MSWHLARELKRHYANQNRVQVNIGFNDRKYYRWGVCLLGLSHAEEVSDKWNALPSLMSNEAGEDWAHTTHREWLLGHTHQRAKKETLPVAQKHGVIMRTLPPLSAHGSWEFRKGYTGPRASEAYLYSKTLGYKGHFAADAREA